MAESGETLFDAFWLAQATGGVLKGNLHARVSAVEVDSRAVRPGALFVALLGERVDGHDYIGVALSGGASVVLACEKGWASRAGTLSPQLERSGAAVVLVPDALAALQDAALAWRRRFPNLVRVGITGSSGKTTTKECLGSILDKRFKTAVNPGNLNSEIGLPQALFLLRAEHEVGVFEMGINHYGEMDALIRVWEPSHALITNIGTAHVGIFGSRKAIAEEKKKIFASVPAAGTALAWEDDEYLAFLREGIAAPLSTFGPRTLAGFEGAEDAGLDGWILSYCGKKIAFPLTGSHNLLDSLAAIAMARALGCEPGDMKAGLESVKPIFGRSEIFRGAVTVIQDCYNANPDSMEKALDFCDALSWEGRRVYVLGSMKELGQTSEQEHRALGRRAGASRADAILFFGSETASAAEEAHAAGFRGILAHTDDFDELARTAGTLVREGDLWFLKASRSMELERLTNFVRRG
jgi:UDP-N-acetylmuramoyl-tripeptide--D-alanyl-D-alanine ligase